MVLGTSRPIAVDLFAGAGGMTLGFEAAGFDVLAAVEFDPIHASTHEYNFPFWTTLCKSVSETTGAEIRALSTIGERDIDVVFGGPPCQGFSLMGKRDLSDSRNSLVFHFLRLVLELQPKYFVMENVKGMTMGKQQQVLHQIMQHFQEHNYQVQENYQVLNAANYGVPQNRQRLFLIGCRQDLKLPNYPPATTQILEPKKQNIVLNLPPTPTVVEAIGDLPEATNYPELNIRDWAIVDYGNPSKYAQKLRNSNLIRDDYSYQRQYNDRLLTSSRLTKHTPQTIARFSATQPGKTERISHFPRLKLNGLCNTLRAGTASNRGAHTSPRPIHPITPRCITVREAARLHSYPDWFRFHVTKWHGFRQIGNSVPPLLAKAVANEIIKVLAIHPHKPHQQYYLNKEELLQFKMSQAEEHHHLKVRVIPPRLRK